MKKTTTKICEEHGEYTVEIMDLLGKEMQIGSCPQCSAIRKEEEERKEKSDYRKKIRDRKLACGISKRLLDVHFDDFKIDPEIPNQAIAERQFTKLAEMIKQGETGFNIIGVGLPGTGKTMLASATVAYLIENGKRAKLVKAMDMIRELRATWGMNSYEIKSRGLKTEMELINHYTEIDLLVLDEIGTQGGSDNEKQHIFDIIDGRYRNELPTVLLSNLTREDVQKTVGDRVIDRLREGGGTLVVFDWESMRGPKEVN